MIHSSPGPGAVPVPPPIAFQPAPLRLPAALAPPHLSREMIRRAVTVRRELLADLEAQMVEACDAAAGRGVPASAHDDRRRWDRTAWGRYLAAATRLEGSYGPRMRRLRDDIARLDRLLDLRIAA